MTNLIKVLGQTDVTIVGVIRDRTLPQDYLQKINNFAEEDKDTITRVGEGKLSEAVLLSNHQLHLVSHAPTKGEPERFEIRSVPVPTPAVTWLTIAIALMGISAIAWLWHGSSSGDRKLAEVTNQARALAAEAGDLRGRLEEKSRALDGITAKLAKLQQDTSSEHDRLRDDEIAIKDLCARLTKKKNGPKTKKDLKPVGIGPCR